MKRSLFAIAGAAAVLMLGSAAQADTIADFFGPGHTYRPSSGESIIGANAIVNGRPNTLGEFDAIGVFTPSQDYNLTQLDLALNWISGGNSFTVHLDKGFVGPDLGVWTVSNVPTFDTTNNIVQTISGITGITLLGGATYDIQVNPIAANTLGTFNNGVNFQPAAFDVLGTPVAQASGTPEPAAWAMMLIGFAGLGAALRAQRSRRANA